MPRAYGLVAAAFAAVAVYIALLPLIGFRLATVLFVAAFQVILELPRTLLGMAAAWRRLRSARRR